MHKIPHTALLLAFLTWSAGWSIAGWTLSGLGLLGTAGCAVALAAIAALTFTAWRGGTRVRAHGGWIRLSRFRRNRWAQLFLALLVCSAAGGIWAEPGNIDALTYRFPKLFHWTAQGGWHWIDTANTRMNVTASGSEWLALPAWALFHDIRSSAWPSLVAYLLMPGLVFGTLRSLGVHGRVARRWMWLLPSGLGYVLQAGSTGNDLLGAVYFLAALDLAARARRASRLPSLALPFSVLAMALATGVKLSNAPLGLAWAVAVWPSRHRLLSPAAMAAVLAGICVSALPTMVLNRWQTGDFSGDPLNTAGAKPSSAMVGLAANALLLTTQTVMPPVFPVAAKWNVWTESLTTTRLAAIREGFPRFTLRAGELAQEEWAGLGLGLVLVLLHGRFGKPRQAWRWASHGGLCIIAAWAGLGVYCVSVASEMPARLLLPYYPLLIAGVLARTSPRGPMDRRSGRWLAAATVWVAGAMLVLGPARPLWPWRATLEKLSARAPGSQAISRAKLVYSVYADRPDHLAALREAIPATATRIGFIGTPDDSEISLWRPLGSRTVVTGTDLKSLRARDASLQLVVARMDAIGEPLSHDLEAARAAGEIELVIEKELLVKASAKPERWSVWRWK